MAGSRVMGVAPWFSRPGLASAVRRRKVRAASVVSCQPCSTVQYSTVPASHSCYEVTMTHLLLPEMQNRTECRF